MKPIRIFVPAIFFTLLSSLILLRQLPVMGAAASSAAAGNALLVEYGIPIADAAPRNIVVEAPGRVWFTAQNNNSIGRLVVTDTTNYQSVQFTFYKIPAPDSQPYDLAFDGGSAIWFTELAGNNIGRLDINTGQITEYAIPTANSAPTGIVIAPDGKIWFVERDGNKIGYYDPDTSSFFEKAYPRSGALLEDIDAANSNIVWFTAPGLETPRIVQYDLAADQFSEVAVVHPDSPSFTPGDVLVDETGIPWISTSDGGLIGRFAPGTLFFFFWYTVSSENAGQSALAQTISGTQRLTWFTETNSGYVGVLTTKVNGTYITHGRYRLPSAGSQPTGIAVDSQGRAWIAEYGTNKIAEWRPPYFTFTYLPAILKQ